MPENLLSSSFGIPKSVLSQITVTPAYVYTGKKFLSSSGIIQTGTLNLAASATEGDVKQGKTFFANGTTLRTGNLVFKGSVFLAYGFSGYLGSFSVSNCYAVVVETWSNGHINDFSFSTTSGTITESWQDGRRYFLINNINGSATISPSAGPVNTWMVAWGFRV